MVHMMMDFSSLVGGWAGLASGAVIAVFSYIAPMISAGNFISRTEKSHIFGYSLTHREAAFLGLFVYLVFSMFIGWGYAYAVHIGWLPDFHFWTLCVCSSVAWVLVGLILVPFLGGGWFGIKHDIWMPIDALLSHILWVLMYWQLVRMWLHV